MSVVAEDRIGTELAGYRIERVLGRGGMSVVYLAHDPRLKRNVTLKLLAPELAEEEGFRVRFVRESRLAASLDHPNVVPVYEAGAVDGRADVYWLAGLLYECLVGDVPFRRASDVAVIYAHLEEPAPKASEGAPTLPATLDAVLERGTAKLPDARWQTCAALVEAARSALEDGAATVRVRRLTRRRGIAAALMGVAAVAATLAALMLGREGTALARSDSLVRIDLGGGQLTGGVAVGAQPTAVTVCGGSVWVTTRAGTVFQVDPKSLTPHKVRVRGTPSDVANVGDLAAVVSG